MKLSSRILALATLATLWSLLAHAKPIDAITQG